MSTPPSLSLEDLLTIIGDKEASIYALRAENARLRAEVASLKKVSEEKE